MEERIALSLAKLDAARQQSNRVIRSLLLCVGAALLNFYMYFTTPQTWISAVNLSIGVLVMGYVGYQGYVQYHHRRVLRLMYDLVAFIAYARKHDYQPPPSSDPLYAGPEDYLRRLF